MDGKPDASSREQHHTTSEQAPLWGFPVRQHDSSVFRTIALNSDSIPTGRNPFPPGSPFSLWTDGAIFMFPPGIAGAGNVFTLPNGAQAAFKGR